MAGTVLFYALFIATCQILTQASHPEFIKCKPSDEGAVILYKNSTWQECKNGQLVPEYCVAEVTNGHYDCVPHSRVKARLDTYTSIFTRYIAAKYYTDGNKQYAHCVKIQAEKQSSLQESKFKKDCTDGLEKSQGRAANELCGLKNKKVYSLDDNEWYVCKNGAFQLEKCWTTKSDGKYYCIPIQKIETALRSQNKQNQFNQQSGPFCYKFFQNPASYYLSYENDLTACNN